MTKGSNNTKCVLHSIGLQLLEEPSISDRRLPGHIFSSIRGEPFSSSRYTHRGRIRIPVSESDDTLKSAILSLRKYRKIRFFEEQEFIIGESMLTDIICFNSTLDSIRVAPEPNIRDQPRYMEIDFSAPQAFNEFTSELSVVFQEDFRWSDIGIDNLVYYSATAVLVVDNKDAVISAIEDQEIDFSTDNQVVSQIEVQEEGPVIIKFLRPMKDLRIPNITLMEYPIVLIVFEDSRVFQWLEGKKRSMPDVMLYKLAVQYLRDSLRQSRMQFIDWQIEWVNSRLSELLISLPKKTLDSVDANQERIEKLLQASEEISFFGNLHLLVKDFIEKEEYRIEAVEEELPLESVSALEENKNRLLTLDEKITKMEKAIQTKLTLENMIVEKQKVDQQRRIESSYDRFSLLFAIFVIFEIVATGVAWFFPPADLLGLGVFVIMIVVIFLLWYRGISKTEDVTKKKMSV